MNSQQANWIAKNPKAMMDYKLRGRVPRLVRPQSPLITLLETFTPTDRLRIRGVQLSPKLGYQTRLKFHNAERLYRWLKPYHEIIEGQAFPAENFRHKGFTRPLRSDDLKSHSAQWHDE